MLIFLISSNLKMQEQNFKLFIFLQFLYWVSLMDLLATNEGYPARETIIMIYFLEDWRKGWVSQEQCTVGDKQGIHLR